MNPLHFLNATLRGIISGAKPAAAKTVVRRVAPKVAIKTAVDYGPDVAISVPVEMALSKKPDIRRAVMNAANEVALTAATGGTNVIPQLIELGTSFNRNDPTVRSVNNLARLLNPSHITEALTDITLYGRPDPAEMKRSLQAAAEERKILQMLKDAEAKSTFAGF